MQQREVTLEIVVDDGSTDGTLGVMREIVPDVRIILNASNLGVARARSQGVKVASAKYIVLLDSDTEMAAGSLGGWCGFSKGAFPLVVEEELHSIDRSTAQPIDYVIGACQLIRKEMLDRPWAVG